MPDFKYVPQNGHKLYNHLAALPAGLLFHEKHGDPLAHPAEILAEKLGEVVDRFVDLARSLGADGSELQRPELTKGLVHSLNEFYDQTFVIMKCVTAPVGASGAQQADILSFLRAANGAALGKFYGSTKREHSLIREMANVLKHQHSTIELLEVVNHHGVAVPGFTVQTVIGANDLRGPSRAIHAMYRRKVHTAFSFNHFLLNVLGRVFSYMERLDTALFAAGSNEQRHRLSALDRLISAAEPLKTEFYPDEYARPFAQLTTSRDTRVVTFPMRYRLVKGEEPDRILEVRSSGAFSQRTSRSHQAMPYLQLTRPDGDWVL